MGNVLSNQYAGYEAHKQTIKDDRSKVNQIMGNSLIIVKDILISHLMMKISNVELIYF